LEAHYENLLNGDYTYTEAITQHPDLNDIYGKSINTLRIKEACELAMDAAKYIPDGFIGWDIAVTPFGPTIIEGNEDPHLFMSDVAYGGLLKNLLMKKVMARLK